MKKWMNYITIFVLDVRFPCEKCGKTFATQGSQREHMKSVHEEIGGEVISKFDSWKVD